MTEHLYLIIGIALIISALISIPLIIILSCQLRHIKIQTDNLGEEMGNRMRPWIKINVMFASPDSVMGIMLSIALSVAEELDPKNPIKIIIDKTSQIKAWREDSKNS